MSWWLRIPQGAAHSPGSLPHDPADTRVNKLLLVFLSLICLLLQGVSVEKRIFLPPRFPQETAVLEAAGNGHLQKKSTNIERTPTVGKERSIVLCKDKLESRPT